MMGTRRAGKGARQGAIVFFGAYLSAIAGTTGSSETIARGLAERGYSPRIVSRRGRAFGRVAESLYVAATARMRLAVLDVYSSRIIRLSGMLSRVLVARNIPYVASLHGGALLQRYPMIRATLDPILAGAARAVTPSYYLRAGFGRLGFEVERIPNAVDLKRFPFKPRSAPVEPIRLLWVRAFEEVYRPHLAVEVVHHLLEREHAATLTMVGPDHGLRAATEVRAISLGVGDRVRFVGAVPNQELSAYYHGHDYLLNTTRFESFGNANVEAAATGLPVVSAPVGEVGQDWTDNQDIFLVDTDAAAGFANRILAVQTARPIGASYLSVSATALEKVKEYGIEKVLPRWEGLIGAVASEQSH